MTEKRFTKQEVYDGINRYRINESNFIVEILDDGIPMHYSTIVNRLNEQDKTITRLEKENEQLKQFQDRVFSWIDMHLQRLPTLIDDEFNSDNEFADPSLYSGALQILETMKKELKGDFE